MKPFLTLFTLALLSLPFSSERARASGVPLPQMKPCMVIDDAAVTSVIRIIRYVAKTDYNPPDMGKGKIQDRLPVEKESMVKK